MRLLELKCDVWTDRYTWRDRQTWSLIYLFRYFCTSLLKNNVFSSNYKKWKVWDSMCFAWKWLVSRFLFQFAIVSSQFKLGILAPTFGQKQILRFETEKKNLLVLWLNILSIFPELTLYVIVQIWMSTYRIFHTF